MAESFKHIYKIDLNQPLKRFDVGDILASGDEKANSFEVAVCRDGANVDLAGCAVYGYFIRPNEETMKVDGTASGNKACVDLSKSCYVYDGAFSFAIKITGNGITQTVAVFDGRIVKTTSESIIDGDRVIYGLEDLLAQIVATEAAASSANAAAASANTAAGNANKWANAEAKATAIASGSQPTVNVTGKNGKKVLTFGVPAGATPDITFRVATGEPGTQVEIQQSGTPEAPVIDLTIPRGDTGAVDGVDYYEGTPAELGEASPGTANSLARGNHVHPMPTASDIGALPVSGTAADSEKLGGKAPEYYIPTNNELDNSYFVNPVNQRGQTSYTSAGYTIDRWRIQNGNTLTVNDGYITITNTGSSRFYMEQRTEKSLSGKAMTIGIKLHNGNIYAGSYIAPNETGSIDAVSFNGSTLRAYHNGIALLVKAGESIDIDWIVLYEGSYTADTLPPYVPKGYGAELVECQRYYWESKMVYASKENYARWILICNVKFPQTMRVDKPTITIKSPNGTPNRIATWTNSAELNHDAIVNDGSLYAEGFNSIRMPSEVLDDGTIYAFKAVASADL